MSLNGASLLGKKLPECVLLGYDPLIKRAQMPIRLHFHSRGLQRRTASAARVTNSQTNASLFGKRFEQAAHHLVVFVLS